MKLIESQNGIYTNPQEIFAFGNKEIAFLKEKLQRNEKGRVRINVHNSSEELIHEMFIAISPDSYIRPHKHLAKSEAFHIVHGEVDVIIFSDNGNIIKIISLSEKNSNKPFYYRMSKPFFHTLIIHSDILVVHEITNGPFIKGATIYADFSPDEHEAKEIIKTWQNNIRSTIRKYNA